MPAAHAAGVCSFALVKSRRAALAEQPLDDHGDKDAFDDDADDGLNCGEPSSRRPCAQCLEGCAAMDCKNSVHQRYRYGPVHVHLPALTLA